LKLTGNTILITGGTSGIGRALASELHQRGNRVIITGRRQALLDEIADEHPGMSTFQLDVDDPAEIQRVAPEVKAGFPELNVLVNNAGISHAESLVDGDLDLSVAESVIRTNILGVLHVTAAFLPVLQRQPAASIVTTTSGLAFVPRANYPTYCASKAFLHSWLQALRTQLKDSSVEVLELVPPYVQTELAGPDQASDPNAMALNHYVAEVIRIVGDKDTPSGEILVERVRMLRHAEAKGTYSEIYTWMNGV
jgi:uncharacterized oxidoreductase